MVFGFGTQKTVTVKVDMDTKGLDDGFKRATRTTDKFKGSTREVTEELGLMHDDGFMPMMQVSKQTTTGFKKFRMEMLGILFFGMGINKMFGGMTQGAKDWLGVGELFKTSMNLIALEGLLPVSDEIFGVIDGLLELPLATKKSLGQMMLFGEMGGLVMQTLGSLVLGLTSIATAFPAIAGPAGIAVGIIFGKMTELLGPVFKNVEGLEKLEDAFQLIAGGIAGAGAAQTVTATLKFTNSIADPAVRTTLTSALQGKSQFGKAAFGFIGGAFLVKGAFDFKEADASLDPKDKLIPSLETILGTTLLLKGTTKASLPAAVFAGIGMAVVVNAATSSDDMLTKMEGVFLGFGILLGAAGLWELAIPVFLFWGGWKGGRILGFKFGETEFGKKVGESLFLQDPEPISNVNDLTLGGILKRGPQTILSGVRNVVNRDQSQVPENPFGTVNIVVNATGVGSSPQEIADLVGTTVEQTLRT